MTRVLRWDSNCQNQLSAVLHHEPEARWLLLVYSQHFCRHVLNASAKFLFLFLLTLVTRCCVPTAAAAAGCARGLTAALFQDLTCSLASFFPGMTEVDHCGGTRACEMPAFPSQHAPLSLVKLVNLNRVSVICGWPNILTEAKRGEAGN